MKIYTKSGDQGQTSLFGGHRVAKSHPRIEAYGTVDEVNAYIGLIRAVATASAELKRLDIVLDHVQNDLFILGADLATPADVEHDVPRIETRHVDRLESEIDTFEEDLPSLKHFIVPGGTHTAALLHVARTVCRRAERLTVEASGLELINSEGIRFLNRLSDLLFVLARWANHQAGVPSTEWIPNPR